MSESYTPLATNFRSMPVIRPLSNVLVSGANGFIATWVIRNLLEHGYSVRGTVRSSRKGEHLKKYFARYGDKLEIVIVEDITKVVLLHLRVGAKPPTDVDWRRRERLSRL